MINTCILYSFLPLPVYNFIVNHTNHYGLLSSGSPVQFQKGNKISIKHYENTARKRKIKQEPELRTKNVLILLA